MRSCVAFTTVALSLVGASGQAAPVERRLHVAQAEASSFDKNDYNRFEENYLPLYVADDDPTTAWTEGAAGDGTGEWLRVRFSVMKGATQIRLRVRNGYQKSHKLFLANERAKKVVLKLLPDGETVERELKDQEGWQEVLIAPAKAMAVLGGVEMKVVSIYKGTKYEDLCISDVQVFVTAETPDNPAYEKGVFEKVKKWKSDRVSAAQGFAKASRERPLSVASSYDVQRAEGVTDWKRDSTFSVIGALDEHTLSAPEREALANAKKWIAHGGAPFEPVAISTSGQSKIPAIDGMCAPALGSCEQDFCDSPMGTFDSLPLTSIDTFKVIEMKERPPVANALDATAAQKYKACHSKDGATLAWAVREGADRKTRAVLIVGCGLVEGREGKYVASALQLLVYDPTGHLRLSATETGVTTYDWKGDGAAARIEGGTFLTSVSSGTFKAAAKMASATPATP